MSFSTVLYFCLQCNNSAKTSDGIIHKECLTPMMVVKAHVTFEMKRTRWARFVSWLLSRDIALGLSILGMVGLNAILMRHFQVTFVESLWEGFCFGLIIPRILGKP